MRVQLVAILASSVLLLLVLELVRRKRLLERYALLWLFSALVLLALSIWQGVLGIIAHAIGISSPPNALFVIAFGFLLVLLLHFSLVVSRLSDQTRVLAQRLAMLEQRQREAREAAQPNEPEAPQRTRRETLARAAEAPREQLLGRGGRDH